MVSTIDIRISKNNYDFNERELKILEVLILNLSAHANAQVNGCLIALNPIEKLEKNIFSYQIAFQEPITYEKYEKLKEAINARVNCALKMCDIENYEITYIENSFENGNSM